ncbi:MAG: transglycosylase SLT domain-containing protein [Burkholderiaceae bacterium]|jgi:membrane-bound lytic murein transglycosylase D|nr:transglycosylase SLT domain-containing protein [Burkholderiaceae bacterium]
MKFKHFASVAVLLLVAACATTPIPTSVEPISTEPTEASASKPAGIASAPAGPLLPLASGAASSQPVKELAPPRDLWERIRRGFAIPDLESDLVRDREQWYTARPEYITRMSERSSKYIFHIVEELERRNMPTELALLPFIESAFNPQAVSSAKAAGMWQFIPSTGKHFALKQNMFHDDRRDVLASTRAALDYLQKLHGMFGDWHLALAAYNWGEGSVSRAIAKNKKASLPTGYTDLNMPAETRFYIPKLQAVKNIVANPDKLNARLPDIPNHPYFQQVPITRDIDVSLAAKLANVKLEDFKALNPSANKPVILASGTPQILLPWDNATIFEMGMESYKTSGQLATWTAWVAPKTMTPAEAAKLVGMKEIDLRSVNHIPPKMLVKVGSTLMVPRDQHKVADVSHQVADNAQLSLTPEIILHKTQIKAGKGETVASVAKRYKISPNIVAEWNKTTAAASFKPGQQVVLFLPARAKTKPGANASQIAKKPPTKSAPVAKVNIAKR